MGDPRIIVTPESKVEPHLRKLARALIALAKQQLANEQAANSAAEPPQETAA